MLYAPDPYDAHVTAVQSIDVHAPHAAPNYQQVGADSDSLAHKFTAAAGLVDPETPAVDMVSASEKTHKAWGDACPRHAPIDSERSQPV